MMTVQCLAMTALFGLSVGCTPRQYEYQPQYQYHQAQTPQTPYQPKDHAQAQAPARGSAQAKRHHEPKPSRVSNRFESSAKPIGMIVEPEAAAEIGYRLGWASPITLLPGQSITSVTVLGDMIFVVEDPRNVVTALNASDGKLLWKTVVGSKVESLFAPSRDGKQIFIHTASRFITLNAITGEVTSSAPLASPVSSKGVYAPEQRIMVMAGIDGLIYGHSVNSNFARWRYRMANRVTSHAVLGGQDAFIVDSGGTYAMLETATGQPLWRHRTLGRVSTSPAIQGSEAILASEDGKLYALNRTTGRTTWKYLGAEQPLKASPTALGRLILQPLLPNPGIVAVDAITGKEIWRANVTAKPVLARKQDILLHNDHELIAASLDDGSVKTKVPTNRLHSVLPIGDDGGILLVSPKGRLLKLSPL